MSRKRFTAELEDVVGGYFFFWIYLRNTIWNLPGSSGGRDLWEGIYGEGENRNGSENGFG